MGRGGAARTDSRQERLASHKGQTQEAAPRHWPPPLLAPLPGIYIAATAAVARNCGRRPRRSAVATAVSAAAVHESRRRYAPRGVLPPSCQKWGQGGGGFRGPPTPRPRALFLLAPGWAGNHGGGSQPAAGQWGKGGSGPEGWWWRGGGAEQKRSVVTVERGRKGKGGGGGEGATATANGHTARECQKEARYHSQPVLPRPPVVDHRRPPPRHQDRHRHRTLRAGVTPSTTNRQTVGCAPISSTAAFPFLLCASAGRGPRARVRVAWRDPRGRDRWGRGGRGNHVLGNRGPAYSARVAVGGGGGGSGLSYMT